MTSPFIRLNDYATRGLLAVKEPQVSKMGAFDLGESRFYLDKPETRQTVVLPAPPSANRYWRNVRGRMVKSRAARAYASDVWTKMAGLHTAMNYPVAVEVRWARKHRRGDLDNRLKVVLDSLRGRAWVDDKQVVELHAYRTDEGDDTVTVTWWAV